MNLKKVFTIGVYGRLEQEFFDQLITNKIDVFIDIRMRRAVRGSKYSFVNSPMLQANLNKISIKYLHVLQLAPTNEIRELQKQEDVKNRINKSKREKLGDTFSYEYEKKVIKCFDFDSLITKLNQMEAQNVVLFCVEKAPQACHRSIVADKIHKEFNLPIQHI